MSVSSNDFLNIAESCIANENGEIGYRNAISRGYYAAYHSAVSCLNDGKLPRYNGKESKNVKGGTHAKLSYYFENDAANDLPYEKEKLELIGVQLRMLHKLRVNADYRIEKKIDKVDAQDAIIKAKKIMVITHSLLEQKKQIDSQSK
ncbi:hypothetical protein [Providencia alcalifaciens]|uniref:hypothetical protein n=1 Tax=Providencia TaxID=586 RepID=UPI0004524D65|nr:hypothetical protein [Providencia alcalifaciens]EUC94734.1 hypothetical protein HMPREF1567_0947 [Providencia alcalifaciens PAL-2]HEM6870748.1 hypothetical protein [Providencia stuartii]